MSQLVPLKKSEPSQTSIQKTFHRLQKKIERLQKRLSVRCRELDEGVKFYGDKIWPA